VPDPETTPPTPPAAESVEPAPAAEPKRFADLDLLQEEVARRLADNRKFLANFLDEDYAEDDEAAGEADADEEDFEEL